MFGSYLLTRRLNPFNLKEFALQDKPVFEMTDIPHHF